MASQQLSSETRAVKKQEVSPQEFSYPEGDWSVPLVPNQPSQLVSATLVEAKATVDVFAREPNSVQIKFNLSKPASSYGWGPKSELGVRAKVGENGTYQYKSINAEYVSMPVNQTRAITVVFDFPPNNLAPDNKLHFGLFDQTQEPKGGLTLFGATVQDANAILTE